jgi:hypothetical protein
MWRKPYPLPLPVSGREINSKNRYRVVSRPAICFLILFTNNGDTRNDNFS